MRDMLTPKSKMALYVLCLVFRMLEGPDATIYPLPCKADVLYHWTPRSFTEMERNPEIPFPWALETQNFYSEEYIHCKFSSVQSLSCVRLFATP